MNERNIDMMNAGQNNKRVNPFATKNPYAPGPLPEPPSPFGAPPCPSPKKLMGQNFVSSAGVIGRFVLVCWAPAPAGSLSATSDEAGPIYSFGR
jgi:hypothetical protein